MFYHLCLIGAMVIVGSSVPAGKMVVNDLPIYYSMTVRFVIGTVFMYLFVRYKGLSISGLSYKTHGLIALQAMLGSVLFTLFLFEGLKSLSGSASGVITGTLPVVVLVLSFVLINERLNFYRFLAVLVAASGVIMVNISGEDGFSATIKGSILVLTAVLCEAGFLLLRKKLPSDLSSLTLSLYVSFYGFLFFLPFGLYELPKASLIDFSGYLLIAYYGVFITAVAYILWFKGISKVSGAYASVYTAVMPVSAVLLSSLLLGEKLTHMHISGLLLVLVAMFLIRK